MTNNERHLRQQWQQFVAQEAEQVSLEFDPNIANSAGASMPRFHPLWLSAAAVVLGVGIVWWLTDVSNGLAPQQESLLLADAEPPAVPMLLASNYTVDALERRLQQAYLHGATESELTQLWAQYRALTQ